MRTTSQVPEASEFSASAVRPSGWTVSQTQLLNGTVSRTWSRTPGYFKLKAQNAILPVNPLLEESLLINVENGSMSAHHTRGGGYSMKGNIPLHTDLGNRLPAWTSVPAIPSVTASRYNDIAVTAISNARQEMFDSLTFLAELEKTVDLFRSCVSRYTQRALVVDRHARIAFKTAKRGALAPTSTATAMSVFSSTWMEYRYGWTPLAFEMEALYKQYLELSSLFHRVRGAAMDMVPTILSSSTSTGANFSTKELSASGGWLWEIKKTQETKVIVKSKCLLQLDSPFRTSGDPLVTLYEVIPYSWMADWFTNIGESIRAFSPFQQGRVASCSVTTILQGKTVWESVRPSSSAFVVLDSFEPSRFEMIREQKHRFAYTPSFSLSLRCELNLNRIVDAVSLVLMRLAKHLRSIPRESLSNWRHLYA